MTGLSRFMRQIHAGLVGPLRAGSLPAPGGGGQQQRLGAKRVFDVVVSVALLPLLLPVLLGLAVLVRRKLGSPVLFWQDRPGQDGRIFRLFKFRTMTDARDANGDLLPDSQRLARFGSWLRASSLDELPELYNVLKGDMSLVGPRPLLVEYLPLYSQRQASRHRVRPGITGWAQVNGRNALSWEDRLELDAWYVENRTLALDIKILWMTVGKVLRRDGINQPGSATMDRFRGNRT